MIIYQTTTQYDKSERVASLIAGNVSVAPTINYAILIFNVIMLSSSTSSGTVIDKNYSTNSNTIVHNIEQRLGVDMDINSDKELCEVLRENGAGPLYDLLKAAYGKKQKTS